MGCGAPGNRSIGDARHAAGSSRSRLRSPAITNDSQDDRPPPDRPTCGQVSNARYTCPSRKVTAVGAPWLRRSHTSTSGVQVRPPSADRLITTCRDRRRLPIM